jgi:RNA polymerase sigma factor (sigma-70 family)
MKHEEKGLHMQLSKTEKEAWSVFYTRFAPRIFAYISRQVANRQDAEDLLLEVFLSAHRESALGKLPEEQQLAWLRRVARNKLIDYYRHQGLIRWLPLAEASELEDEHLTPEACVEQQEEYQRLSQALQQLSPAQQELVQLRYEHELHLTEIAGILRRSEGAVRKMLTRTLRKLKACYEQLERSRGS